MYIFVELWKPKPEWLTLSKSERQQYLSQLGPAIQSLVDSGVEIITWSLNDPSTPYTTDHVYLGVYMFPTKEQTLQFEQLVAQAGWYDYFDQINAKGEVSNPPAMIGQMLER